MSRIFFYTGWKRVDRTPDLGGPKVGQQHVQILQQGGFDARIVLDGRRRWLSPLDSYEEEIAVKGHTFRREVTPSDVVVVPAIASPRIDSIPGDRKVLMVQNGGLLFESLPLEETDRYPWQSPSVEAVICVSEHDRALIEQCGPTCPVHRVYNQVDPERFDPLPWQERDDLILAVTPRPYKNPWHTATVCHAVRARALARRRRNPDGEVIVPSVRVIQGLQPSEVEDLLVRAKTLVFPSVVEGFPLLALEAVMAGTPVVAYRNQPCDEYMPDAYLHEVGDFEKMVELTETFLQAGPEESVHELRHQA